MSAATDLTKEFGVGMQGAGMGSFWQTEQYLGIKVIQLDQSREFSTQVKFPLLQMRDQKSVAGIKLEI